MHSIARALPMQERWLNWHRDHPRCRPFVNARAWVLSSGLRTEDVAASVRGLFATYNIFSARFEAVDDAAWQVVTHDTADRYSPGGYPGIHEFSESTHGDFARIANAMRDMVDPTRGRNLVAASIHQNDGSTILLLVGHHVVLDELTWARILPILSGRRPLGSPQDWAELCLAYRRNLDSPAVAAERAYWARVARRVEEVGIVRPAADTPRTRSSLDLRHSTVITPETLLAALNLVTAGRHPDGRLFSVAMVMHNRMRYPFFGLDRVGLIAQNVPLVMELTHQPEHALSIARETLNSIPNGGGSARSLLQEAGHGDLLDRGSEVVVNYGSDAPNPDGLGEPINEIPGLYDDLPPRDEPLSVFVSGSRTRSVSAWFSDPALDATRVIDAVHEQLDALAGVARVAARP